MTLDGHVKNGVIVPSEPIDLPEGAVVRIEIAETKLPASAPPEIPTLFERLKPVIGMAKGLPADLSANHDHYLYGTPKRT